MFRRWRWIRARLPLPYCYYVCLHRLPWGCSCPPLFLFAWFTNATVPGIHSRVHTWTHTHTHTHTHIHIYSIEYTRTCTHAHPLHEYTTRTCTRTHTRTPAHTCITHNIGIMVWRWHEIDIHLTFVTHKIYRQPKCDCAHTHKHTYTHAYTLTGERWPGAAGAAARIRRHTASACSHWNAGSTHVCVRVFCHWPAPFTHVCTCVCTCMCVCIQVCVYECVYVRFHRQQLLHICVCICVCVCVEVCVNECV